MNNALTTSKRSTYLRRWVIGVLCFVLAVVLGWFAFTQLNANMREQGAVAMRTAIMESAMQCCAVEGSYPSSLDYLEANYGLVLNHDDYTVIYEAFAANVMPSVVVTPK